MLPLGSSAVTLGMGLLLAFTRPATNWAASPWLIPIAHSLVALPLVLRTLAPAVQSIPEEYHQAASVLGASPWRVFTRVDLPLLRRPLASSLIFSFTVSLGEFGATTFLSRPEYPTIPIAIFRYLSQPGGLNYGQAMALASILLLVFALGIVLIEKLRVPGSDWF
jgi:thiamine transport system permease protein